MSRTALLALLAVPACYQSHELGGDASVPDGGPTMCALGEPLVVSLYPPRPAGSYGVTLTGVDGDPTADTLTFHLDACPGPAPCTYDLVLHHVGPLASGLPFVGPLVGALDWHDASAHLLVSDRCVTCTNTIELFAGVLPPFVAPVTSLSVAHGDVECADACNDYGGLRVEGYGDSLIAATGVATRGAMLSVYVASAREDACRRCRCSLPDVPATGLIYAARLFVAR